MKTESKKAEKKKPCDWCLKLQMERDGIKDPSWYSDDCSIRSTCPAKKVFSKEISLKKFMELMI
jgi:hypothetical protein